MRANAAQPTFFFLTKPLIYLYYKTAQLRKSEPQSLNVWKDEHVLKERGEVGIGFQGFFVTILFSRIKTVYTAKVWTGPFDTMVTAYIRNCV